ncbi:DUF5343 domain-containing protein [Alcanivorax sp. S71-1-4]|jgi:hypothetical protein|uniref:DUF5343 domain-containing protein n=1 Tax=Alcanivorax sp. S71-1-4 TaxID=1177159 RepID=UPI00135A3AF2|nr:DUF5343 domain-containing protein [Alcanivorax sp. S71-1-4]
MAEDKKKGYPMIAQANWFGLRDKLKQRVPAEISSSYVASAMSMAEASARSNVVSPLKALGIIGADSKPTDLAYDWRDDSKYPGVCESIIDTIYPQELRDLYHTADAELGNLTTWFMRDAKVGEAAAKKYAATYLMLLQKKPEPSKDLGKASSPRTKSAKKQDNPKPKTSNPKAVDPAPQQQLRNPDPNGRGFSPKLHIDVQVHISPESSPEQIDKIFESMAKHLKDFNQ